jgi:hypothetical protein
VAKVMCGAIHAASIKLHQVTSNCFEHCL